MTMLLRAVRRETAAATRDGGRVRPIVVELHAGYMVMRPKGCRRAYTLTYQSAYMLAVRQAVEEERREKKARKGAE